MILRLHLLHRMFTYLSIWADVQTAMVLLPSLGMSFAHRIHETKRTLFALCVCSCGGLYNAYIRPRTMYVSYLDHTFDGWKLCALDMIGHQLLLFCFYTFHVFRHRYLLSTSPTFAFHILWMPMLYVLSMPFHELYGFSWIDVMLVACLSVLVYGVLSVPLITAPASKMPSSSTSPIGPRRFLPRARERRGAVEASGS